MFHRKKKREAIFGLNRKGFSLVEILIAVGILVMITVPLAMNMVSSSQINSKAKQTAVSSDLTTAIIEMMQTVDLSDVLTDVNGYTADEYGTDLPYTLTKNIFKKIGYEFDWTAEMILDEENGVYSPVKKQEEVIHDYLVTSSINTRVTGDVTRAYFTGQDDDNYAFVVVGAENDEVDLDIVATIVPEQVSEPFDIVNITSMAQSEVIYVKQTTDANKSAANTFKKANDKYIALGGTNAKDLKWFEDNMQRTITVTIKQDAFTESATVLVEAVYTVEEDCLRAADKTIKKTLGSFSTNSTAEFARGVYVYYYPLMDTAGVGSRDHFIVNNKNELAAPVYLIAMADGAPLDVTNISGYHPTLSVNELSDQIYTEVARTTVCSNIDNGLWQKSLYPLGRTLNVKTLGNSSQPHTLYRMTIEVYRHRDASFDNDNKFTPNERDLLISTTGSFIDTSEKLDIDSDKTTGLTETPGIASAFINTDLVYNGEMQTGVRGEGVDWSGTTEEIDAGVYVAKATPSAGYIWPDGSTTTRTLTWEIKRKPFSEVIMIWDNRAAGNNPTYNAELFVGVSQEIEVEFVSGTKSAYDAGTYSVKYVPTKNYCWKNENNEYTWEEREFVWRIYPRTVTITWNTGEGYDRWEYNGKPHTGSFTIGGLLEPDKNNCSAIVQNITITRVGEQTAEIIATTNKNYTLPQDNLTHVLTVYKNNGAYVDFKSPNKKLVYNGQIQTIVDETRVQHVILGGDQYKKDVGVYVLTATPTPGMLWSDTETDETRYITWEITQLVAELKWAPADSHGKMDIDGTMTWEYDGNTHQSTCIVTNKIGDDVVDVTLTNNSIRDVGNEKVTATKLSNPNYAMPSTGTQKTLIVTRAKLAKVDAYSFDYDGKDHVGVVGQYIKKVSGTFNATNVLVASDGYSTDYYAATVEPLPNYAWADGTYGKVTKYWQIKPKKDARYDAYNVIYVAKEVQGVFPYNADHVGGAIKGTTVGNYSAQLKPITNHAWADSAGVGTCEIRTIPWQIVSNEFFIPSIAGDSSFVYNSQSQSPSLDIYAMTPGIKIGGQTSGVDVGTYTITLSLVNPNGSKWSDGTTGDKTLTWYITPATVGYSYNKNEWEYDGTTKTGTATISGVYSGDDCYFTYTGNQHSKVGSHEFTISGLAGADKGNYKLPASVSKGTMKITATVIGINWGTLTFNYNGSEHVVNPTATGLKSGDTCTFTVTGNKRTNAGSQPVKITGLSNSNYCLPSDVEETMTVNRVKGATAEPDNKTYNGTSQRGVKGNYVTWRGEEYAIDVGPHTAYATPDGNHTWSNGGTEEREVKWTMSGSTAAFTAPQAKTLTYNGSDQVLITAGSSSEGTMYYRLDSESSWSTNLPKGKDAGWYKVWYYCKGDANHNDSVPGSLNVQILKAAGSVTDPVGTDKRESGFSYTFGRERKLLITKATSTTGTVEYKVVKGTWSTNWSTAEPIGKDSDKYIPNWSSTEAGTYTVYYRVTESANYNAVAEKSITVTIDKSKKLYNVPPTAIEGLQYNGSAQALITAGSAIVDNVKVNDDGTRRTVNYGGKMEYKLGDNGTWSETIPTATNAGTYKVYYRTTGNDHYFASSGNDYVEVTIKNTMIHIHDKIDIHTFLPAYSSAWNAMASDYHRVDNYDANGKKIWWGTGDTWWMNRGSSDFGPGYQIFTAQRPTGYRKTGTPEIDLICTYTKWATTTHECGFPNPEHDDYMVLTLWECDSTKEYEYAVSMGGYWFNLEDIVNNANIIHSCKDPTHDCTAYLYNNGPQWSYDDYN